MGGDRGVIEGFPEIGSAVLLRGDVWSIVPRPGVDDLELSRTLHDTPGIRWAHPDLLVPIEATTAPDDPYWGEQWHLENTGQGGRTAGVDINAGTAWEYASGAGQIIGILDSGVQLDHPDLSVVGGIDVVDDDDDPTPDTSTSAPHGTSVAGVAAARGNNGYGVAGVAWGADVYAVRLIGGDSSLEDLYLAFVTTVDAGAAVLSNSWGWANGCAGIPDYSVFGEMFNYADEYGRDGLGSVVVFAAGNDACDIQDDGMLKHKKLVVVAAVEWNDIRAWYSNYGEWVDIAAPTTLLTTDIVGGGYGSYAGDDALVDGFGGTSAAAPVVSGVIALMMEANPRITGDEVREALCLSATRNDVANAGYDDEGWSPYYGCGRIDAGAAVAAVANGAPEAPVPTLTTAEAWEGRAVLSWESASDPDGDVYVYEVQWWKEGDSEAEVEEIETASLTMDLSAHVSAGDAVHWQVRARDPWGAGPWSVESSFVVLAVPEAPSPIVHSAVKEVAETACNQSGSPMAVVAMVLAAALARRTHPGRRTA